MRTLRTSSTKTRKTIRSLLTTNLTTGQLFSKKIMMYFIKLPLMEKTPEECENIFDIWIYLLKNLENMESIPSAFAKHRIFTDLGDTARLAALTKAEREEYDQSLKIYRDNYAIAQTERRLGKEEGRAEEKRKIVLNMLGCGLPVKDIAKFTGMSIEEVTRLSK